MGTPDFAVPSLNALVENNYEVVGVVTQMDRPKDRGHALKSPPVKEYAVEHNIPVFQPQRLSREPDMVERLQELKPDIIVTCAFGQILPQSVLDIPKFGTINVHGSLLPKYRGAAPIQRAIINGETKTGITTMLTDIGMDTGDMLIKDEINIPIDMTVGELHDVMSILGANTLIKTLDIVKAGKLDQTRTKQNDAEASHAQKITKETGLIDWNLSSSSIHNLIRGTTPWPGAYSMMSGMRFKIGSSQLSEFDFNESSDSLSYKNAHSGTILKLDASGMWVKTGDGAILITEIQVDSGKRMTPQQYAAGHDLKAGMAFN
jgi:methionyl-tRNA formyltransferase